MRESRAAEICDLGGDGPPPDYDTEVGSWKAILKKLEVASRFCKKLEVGSRFWKNLEVGSRFGKKNVSWKPILKILVKLETFFKKIESWYINFSSWKGRRKCEVGVNIGKWEN